MNEKVLNLLAQSKINNDLSLPIWIYKIENIAVKSRRFIKVYFFNRLFNGVEANQIVVQHQEKEYAIDRFETVSEYQDKNIFGGMVEIPLEDAEEDIVIQKEIVNGKVYQASNQVESFSFAKKPKEDDYLQSKNKAYQKHHEFFPQIHDQWWQCSCGRIHKKDDAICSCGLSLGDMTTIVSFDYEENHIKDALSKGMDLDLTKSFDQNYESYTESLQKYGIASEVWRDRIDTDTERQRYNSLLNEKNQKTAKRKKVTIIAVVISLLAGIGFGVYSFTGKNGEYNKAKRLLKSGEYQEAELIFESLEDYKDSKTMILETRYQDALNRIKNGDTGYIVTNILASLGNYKDAKDQLNEVNYNNAVEDLNTKKYVPAITLFTNLGDYKDSKSLILEAKYGYVKMHNNNTDTLTYSYLKDLKSANYKDSKTLYSDLYDWKYKIVINESTDDSVTSMSSVNLYKKWCCHVKVSGGTPGASTRLSYLGDFPGADSLSGSFDFDIYSGNEVYVEFWYSSIGSYSTAKGTFTFRLYDSSGKMVGSKSVTLR